MISFEAALDIVRDARPRPESEAVALASALGRRLAEDIVAPIDGPSFDNSAMDGYAVGSVGSGPWDVVGMVAAGDGSPHSLLPSQAMRIFTGAPTPGGTAGILPQEDASVVEQTVTTSIAVVKSQHIRKRGEEFKVGDHLIPRGSLITPPTSGVLAALGIASVPVKAFPRIAILSTGNEVIKPGVPLRPGQIYDSNSTSIRAFLASIGIFAAAVQSVDEPTALHRVIERVSEGHDLILTTGGVSVGEFDMVPATMERAGFLPKFKAVAMRPGKPTHFSVRNDGKAWIGLPGNPQSTWAALLLLVLAYLDEELPVSRRALRYELTRKKGRDEFVPARIDARSPEMIVLAPHIGSHSALGLAEADGLVHIPGDLAHIKAGTELDFRHFPWRGRE